MLSLGSSPDHFGDALSGEAGFRLASQLSIASACSHRKMSSAAATILGFVLLCLFAPRHAVAQFDITGSWAARNHEFLPATGGPVDFTGIPLDDEGRIRGLELFRVAARHGGTSVPGMAGLLDFLWAGVALRRLRRNRFMVVSIGLRGEYMEERLEVREADSQ